MWPNGLDSVLVCLVLCSFAYGISLSDTVPEQSQISSRKQVAFRDSREIRYNQLKSKRSEEFKSSILTQNNFENVVKRDNEHHVNYLFKNHEESGKETPIERQNSYKMKRKHRTKERTRKLSYKTRLRKWNDIMFLLEEKKGRALKHSNKFLSRGKYNLKNDKKISGNDNDKVKTAKSKARKKPVKSVKKKHHKHHKNSDKTASKVLSEEKLVSLREALLVHPFKTWKFKDRFKSMADIGIHEAALQDVVENKWNTRLAHKLFKVFKGENIHMAVIGGSNTAGGGIQEDEGRVDRLFFRVISDWWRKTITPITGSHLKTRQIAMGGTGSDFFSYCHRSYVQKNVDLVLLEMSVNDLHELPYNVNLSLPIEQLTRQLLDYPTEPALLYVNLLSGRAYYQGCTNLEDFGQRLLSDVYKVTTLSWRDAVCPAIGGKYRIPLRGCTVVCKDGHHINQLGHAHISLMLINLFRDLLLGSIGHVNELSEQVFHDKVVLPEPVFIAKQSKIITDPICWTTVTPNFKRKIISNSMEVGVMENFGFDFLHYKAIGGRCDTVKGCRADAYSGWTGKDVGATLTLSFTVPTLGHKRKIQSRSVVFATRTCWKCGVAEVWLDDDSVNRRLVRARSQYAQTLLEIVALRVNPGDHTMMVRIVQPGYITVVGVMLGPPDGPY